MATGQIPAKSTAAMKCFPAVIFQRNDLDAGVIASGHRGEQHSLSPRQDLWPPLEPFSLRLFRYRGGRAPGRWNPRQDTSYHCDDVAIFAPASSGRNGATIVENYRCAALGGDFFQLSGVNPHEKCNPLSVRREKGSVGSFSVRQLDGFGLIELTSKEFSFRHVHQPGTVGREDHVGTTPVPRAERNIRPQIHVKTHQRLRLSGSRGSVIAECESECDDREHAGRDHPWKEALVVNPGTGGAYLSRLECNPLQLEFQIPCGLPAVVRVFLEAPLQHAVDGRRSDFGN